MFGPLRRAASAGLRTNARTGCPIAVSCRTSSCPLFPVAPVINIMDYLPAMSPRLMVVLCFHQSIRNPVLEDFWNQSTSCILKVKYVLTRKVLYKKIVGGTCGNQSL